MFVIQWHSMKFCNCSFGIMFPSGKYPECNIDHLSCLSKYNDLFNAEKSDDGEPGIECSCLPECSRTDFNLELQPIYNENEIGQKYVLVDVHYASMETIKYRTDVTFSGMDLIVGFGGIVSLFLGSSIMSLVEIIYFSTISLYNHYRRYRQSKRKLEKTSNTGQKINHRLPFLN
jgi:hypothetical protein